MRPGEHAWREALRAVALCIGGLALMTLLSCGWVFLMQALGIVQVDIDQPRPDLDKVRALAIGSLAVVLCCAAVAGACEVVRRRARARSPSA